MKTLDLILIIGIGGIVIYILSRTGLFSLASKTADTANLVLDKADYVIGSTVDLPENTLKAISSIPDIGKTVGFKIEQATGWDLPDWLTIPIASPTDRAKNIVSSLNALYPGMSYQQQLQMVIQNNINFDERGYPIQ
jgi:hypothetical protein